MVLFETAELLGLPVWLIGVVVVWSLVWKGIALWKSSRRNSIVWFVVLLVVNTVGILEILYIFLFSELNFDDKTNRNAKQKSKQKTSKKSPAKKKK